MRGRVCIALAACLLMALARAQAPANEAEAKARFTVTLARFVQWPAAEPGSLRLCVLHNSPAVAAAFDGQQGVLVAGHPLSVSTGPLPRGTACDLLFVDSSALRATAEAFLQPSERPMLTLGAVDGFLSLGGMVELVNVNDALRFDVNLRALRVARLGLSGQVLKLARQVRE